MRRPRIPAKTESAQHSVGSSGKPITLMLGTEAGRTDCGDHLPQHCGHVCSHDQASRSTSNSSSQGQTSWSRLSRLLWGTSTTNQSRALKRARAFAASTAGSLRARPPRDQPQQSQHTKGVRADCRAPLADDLPPIRSKADARRPNLPTSARDGGRWRPDLATSAGEADGRHPDLPGVLQNCPFALRFVRIRSQSLVDVVKHAPQESEAGADEASLSQRRRSHHLSVRPMIAMANLAEQRLQRKSYLAEGRSLDSRGRISFTIGARRRSSAAGRRSSAARRTSSAKG